MRITAHRSITKFIGVFKLSMYDKMNEILPGVLENMFSKNDDDYDKIGNN
jgi:hypothetical protein